MYASDFEYHRAESVKEAIELLTEHDGAQLVAGTHGLLPRMKTGEERPRALVDVAGLDGLSDVDERDDALTIGALVTHARLAKSEPVREHATALADAAGELGDPQVRNGGTIGGNLAHGDARSDPPAAVLALGGSLELRGPDGERRLDATTLFEGHFETAVGDDEVVTALSIPPHDDATSAYVKRRNPLSGYALVGVAAWVRLEDDEIAEARVAATGTPPHPVRLTGVEDELEDATADEETIAAAAARATEGLVVDELRSDVQASAEYRAHLLSVDTERALRRVCGLEDDE
ncbi:FAD binding domain-containing protein [Natronobeatus ordinarius]|uniref:FAD binding domain-containing protein n=1 Tax=Natronobeatus ordinarius TaxID=2963433 RepID=UPI0020CEB076|nr:xanthine dehydrogenase family protein subunit M [Natronobeatus ordinarius]